MINHHMLSFPLKRGNSNNREDSVYMANFDELYRRWAVWSVIYCSG
jgi:hypothetical protein